MEDRFSCVVCADLMLLKNNGGEKLVLLTKRKNTGSNDGEYELPGGHLENNEDLFETMIREAKEELCIELKREDLRIVHLLHHYTENRLNFIFLAEDIDVTPKIGESNKCDAIGWFNINKLPQNITDKVRLMINNINSGFFYDRL
jgi:8-oxo-dGTP pyrophosphatase MutT (NUDIX family)